MISAKNRAFKIQIRDRTTHKKMAKVRFNYWLKDNPIYQELLDQLLMHVALCKFSSPKIDTSAFQQIISLVQKHQQDWNAYLLIYNQIEEINLISMACMKFVPNQDILYLSKLLFLNKEYLKIDREDWRELIVESRQHCLQNCKGSLFTNIMLNLNSFLFEVNKNNISINQHQLAYSNDQILLLHQICKKGESLNPNPKQQFPISETEYVSLIYQICCFLSNNIWIRKIALNSYFNVLIFLMSSLQDIVSEQSSIFIQLRQTISEMLISFEQSDDKKTNWENHIIQPLTLAKLLQFCKLSSPKFIPFVNTCLREGISLNIDPNQKQSIHSQCLQLLLHISYQQKWICYSYFQHFFKMMIGKIEQFDQQMNHNFKNNMFNTKIEDQVVKYEKAHQNNQICIIKIIENLIFNEYEHSCEYDFQSFLETLIQDFIDLNILPKWSQNLKLVQTLQNLVLQLFRTKKQDHQKYLLNIFHVWMNFQTVKEKVKMQIYGQLYLKQKSDHKYLEHIENYENVFEDRILNKFSDQSDQSYDDFDF